MTKYTKDQLESSRDLRGQIAPGKTLDNMTPLEKAVLKHQGLVESGQIKKEAFARAEEGPNLPPHIPAPVPLEDLEPDTAERITDAVSEARGTSAEAAKVDSDKQVDAPLPPPDSEDNDLPPDDTEVASGFGGTTALNVEALLRQAREPIPCPRCTYDVRQRFEDPKFADGDKVAFVRHVLSKSGRFEKSYPIFGDSGEVTFRSRSQAEMELIYEFVRKQVREEEILPGGDYLAQMQRYHIIASVAAFKAENDPDGSEDFPTLDQLAAEEKREGEDHPVKKLDKMIFGSGRASGLYSAVTAVWMEFDRLYGWFASKAHDPDFWQAAAGPRS